MTENGGLDDCGREKVLMMMVAHQQVFCGHLAHGEEWKKAVRNVADPADLP